MSILAQAEVTLDPGWQTLLLGYGPLGVFCLVGLYFLIRYGTRLVEGHLSYMHTSEVTQKSLTANLETLTESHTALDGKHEKTHRALGHLANAAKESDICQGAQQYVEKALDVLGR